MVDYGQVVKDLRLTYETGRSKDPLFRRTQLQNLLKLYAENAPAIIQALQKDLRKPKFESHMYELLLLKRDVKYAISKLKSWTGKNKLPKNLISLGDTVYHERVPYGLVLIIGPWNYPIHLTMMPLAGAIAGGNCVLIKPSEVSSHCAALVGALIPKYLDQECYKVVQGDAEDTQKILKEKFDFVFFTGSSQIGKLIYSQAALQLTPVCLELGGKSPVYIDESADMRMTAERVIWAKLVCLGQTCIAPDYLLCSREVQQLFLKECREVIKAFFGDGFESLKDCKDLGRIVNQRHFGRLRNMLEKSRGSVVVGGKMDEYDLFIEPTIIVDVDEYEPLMMEEIFGPILPIFQVKNFKDAIDFVNNRPNPLALYVFSRKQKVIKTFLEKTNSGGVSVNDALYHTSVADVPFGGLNDSGLGQYHGKFSFETFTRPRAVVHRSFSAFENKFNYALRYPPYTDIKFKMLEFGLGNFNWFYIRLGFVPYLLCFLIGILLMYAIQLGTSSNDSYNGGAGSGQSHI